MCNMDNIFQSSLQSIELYNFRNYNAVKYTDIGPESIVLTGKNGIGKTNILEAISLLTQSKGLRAAKISELNNQANPLHMWRITAQIRSVYGLKEICTQRLVKPNNKTDSRSVSIDGQAIKKKAELNKILNVVWLTPPMQQLFIGSSSARRSFFDQIVCNFFPQHGTHLSKYELSTRERLKLLKNQCADDHWLSALEQNMFNDAGQISDARMNTIALLNSALCANNSPFPKATLTLINEPIPGGYLNLLKKNRGLDAATGRTNLGPHLYDLEVLYNEKNMPARFCSTGEQKALLLSIIIAQVYALIDKYKVTPILLFDEIISHLDAVNRSLLFDQLIDIKAQCWLTGIDPRSFDKINAHAKFIHLEK